MWIYGGVLLSKEATGTGLADVVVKQYPVPNSFTGVLFALAALSVGYEVGAKLLIVAYLLASFWIVAELARAVASRDATQDEVTAKSFVLVHVAFVSFTTGLLVRKDSVLTRE